MEERSYISNVFPVSSKQIRLFRMSPFPTYINKISNGGLNERGEITVNYLEGIKDLECTCTS